MSEQSNKTAKKDEKVEIKTSKSSPKKGKMDKKKKRRILAIILTSVIVFVMLVIGHWLWKSCSPEKPGEDYYYVRVIQPENKEWELKVNDKTGRFPVQYGSTLEISVTPNDTNQYSVMNDKNASHIYYALVQEEETLSKDWKSSQLRKDGDKYVTSFPMIWNYDITVQIVANDDYEDFIYTKDDDEKEVKYTYDSSIYDSRSQISRLNVSTMQTEEVSRAIFNDKIWVGKKVKYLDKSFFVNCPSFNSQITFVDESTLELIGENFLYGCTSFDKPLTFPDSLKTISGNFMYRCTSFNQPIDTNQIEYLDNFINTSFMMYCTSFNSQITIGSSLKIIPAFFLCNCTSFNQDIVIPSTIKEIKDGFLRNCDNMVKTVTVNCPASAFDDISGSVNVCTTSNKGCWCYGLGIGINGSAGSNWLSTFKNLTDDAHKNYRKLRAA